ncbi:MAG: 50S ribosomal protein L15 [Bacteroidota bacterium]
MQLHTLQPIIGALKRSKRIGRGQGSGKGGTATKGHKGAKSRSGYKSKPGFEGGQLPLQKRIPTYGFNNPHRVAYKPINLSILQQLTEKLQLTTIDAQVLAANGLVNKRSRYKILGSGVLKARITVTAHAFSAPAIAAIQKLGGEAIIHKPHA